MVGTDDATDSTSAEASAENGLDGDATESSPEEEMRLEGVSELARTENMTESMGAEENAQSGLNEDGEKVRSEERKRVERVPEMAGTNDATDSTEGDGFLH